MEGIDKTSLTAALLKKKYQESRGISFF